MVLKLQLAKRKKLVLFAIFSLGLFITIIQIIRILTIKSLANYTDSSQLIMWSMVENNLGISIACIPPLAPLIKSFADKTVSGSSGKKRDYQGNSRANGSGYALHTIGGGRSMRGFVSVGSGRDREDIKKTIDVDRTGLGELESSTEELNLPRDKVIHKKTEVVVSREAIAQRTF